LGLQYAERLPQWLYFWLPVVTAVVLSVAWHLDSSFYTTLFAGETGLLEASHFVIPVISIFIGLRILALPEARKDRLVFIWIFLGCLGSFYMAGEEVSWGQHQFGWLTPEAWREINDQDETNLHNTSSWLDQKPRTLLEIGVIVGGIIIPLLALRRPSIRQGRLSIFFPPLVCLPTAVICEVGKIWERLHEIGLWEWVIFYQASEVQELYLSLFILLYLLVFRKRVLARRIAGLPARPAAGSAA
jgi:hypothetical protein